MFGMVHALRDEGIDLGVADLIVGTSAGARVGACIATGTLDHAVAMYQRAQVPQLTVPVPVSAFASAAMAVVSETSDRQEAARRIANFEPLGPSLVPDRDRRRMIEAHLPAKEWPATRLEIVAVDAASGRRVTFDRTSGVSLLDAVTASGALPGLFPLATIGSKRYADGGVHSPFNADLAAGSDVVVVLSPMAADPNFRGLLDTEIATLGHATVEVITPDEASLTAIGPNVLASETAAAALGAGTAQAAREHEPLTTTWQP
jgi:NTE family protein